ncbi:cytochrome C oxidase subunit IV family protein [Comamonas sp. JC664]|uniref:cytochrome C oxidase subunit IV family protein n=1 Tax=Comamonas sp. JC664 TaxID=2801917 RepID=UPI00174D698E|nr:cytochrome C oxidase subunit IV family protein [Comamonas sp. JC664]MBL0694417.1 cytochrome C oxidase subunit IV family protein [Comamonas sp. JC664]
MRGGARHGGVQVLVVGGVLLGLAALSFGLSRLHLGAWAVPVALGIALVKAALIAGFYMHLTERPGGPRLVVGTAGVFVVILVGLVLAEASARIWPTLPPGPFPVTRLPGKDVEGPPRVAPPWRQPP